MALRDAWNPSDWGSAQHAADDFGGPYSISTGLTVTTGAGRFGGAGLVVTNASAYVSTPLDDEDTFYVGFGLKGTGPCCVLRVMDDATEQCSLWLRSDGRLEARRGDASILATGSLIISPSVMRWVEVGVIINNATGGFIVAIEGAADISATNIDTQNTSNAYATQWRFGLGGTAASVNFTLGDGYFVDDAGSDNNFLLGLVRTESKLPSGAGSTGDWTGAYTAVDETTPNDDTDYISTTAGSGDLSSFAMGDLSGSYTSVKGIVVKTRGKRTDAGAGVIQHYVKVGANTDTGADITHAAGAYDTKKTAFDVQPDTSAWDATDWNSAEVGVQEAT